MCASKNSEALEKIYSAGVVGLGGAGFPSHIKYSKKVDILIANGCECEPLLFTDTSSMCEMPEKLFKGLNAVKNLVGAKKTLLAIKKKHTNLISILKPLAEELGIEMVLVDDFYPAGDEQVLIFESTFKSVPPTSIPSSINTLVANTSTLIAVSDSLDGLPLVEKTITVTGDVKNPSILVVPIGTPVSELVDFCGGSNFKDYVFLLGGPMMGTILDDPSEMAKAVVTKTLGGIILLPKGHYLHQNSKLSLEDMRKRAAAACIQCRLCTERCPRYLIGHPFETHRIMRAFANKTEFESSVSELAHLCCECGVCEHISCPMGLSPCSINKYLKKELAKRKISYSGSKKISKENTLWQEYRKVPSARLAYRIDINKYTSLKPIKQSFPDPKEVFIPLRQHIGVPAIACVKLGAKVCKNDLIATIPEKSVGAQVHASIEGTVQSLGENIHIKRIG